MPIRSISLNVPFGRERHSSPCGKSKAAKEFAEKDGRLIPHRPLDHASLVIYTASVTFWSMLVDAAAAKRQDQTLPPLSSYGRSLLEIYQ